MAIQSKAELVFLRKDPRYEREKPYLVLLLVGTVIDPSTQLHNLVFDEKQVSVLDIRDCKESYHLEECGFEYRLHATKVKGILGSEPTLNDVAAYKAETEVFLAGMFGAAKVVCYDLRASIAAVWNRMYQITRRSSANGRRTIVMCSTSMIHCSWKGRLSVRIQVCELSISPAVKC